MSAADAMREGLDALTHAVPRLLLEQRQLREELEEAREELAQAGRAAEQACRAGIASEKRRVLALIEWQYGTLRDAGAETRVLDALTRLVEQGKTVKDIKRFINAA